MVDFAELAAERGVHGAVLGINDTAGFLAVERWPLWRRPPR